MLSWLNDPRHELGLMVMVAKQMPYVQVRFFPLCASYQEMSPILCVEDDDQPCKLFKAAPKIVLRQKKVDIMKLVKETVTAIWKLQYIVL
jgi:hypothetical protein